jgi:hypothetical protein
MCFLASGLSQLSLTSTRFQALNVTLTRLEVTNEAVQRLSLELTRLILTCRTRKVEPILTNSYQIDRRLFQWTFTLVTGCWETVAATTGV